MPRFGSAACSAGSIAVPLWRWTAAPHRVCAVMCTPKWTGPAWLSAAASSCTARVSASGPGLQRTGGATSAVIRIWLEVGHCHVPHRKAGMAVMLHASRESGGIWGHAARRSTILPCSCSMVGKPVSTLTADKDADLVAGASGLACRHHHVTQGGPAGKDAQPSLASTHQEAAGQLAADAVPLASGAGRCQGEHLGGAPPHRMPVPEIPARQARDWVKAWATRRRQPEGINQMFHHEVRPSTKLAQTCECSGAICWCSFSAPPFGTAAHLYACTGSTART